LRELREFLADDQIDRAIRLARTRPAVLIARRKLDESANRNRRRILSVLRPQVHFGADVKIAQIIAGPVCIDARVPIDDAAEARISDESGDKVAIDPRVEDEGSEDLGAVADPDAERAGEVADVGVALDEIRSAAISGHRPL